VGGFACALRTIPKILEIAHAMEELAPDGMMINFTNPAGIIAESVIRHSSIKSVGLCNIPIGMIMETTKFFDCKPEEVEMDYVGLNHLSWVRSFKVAGKDVTQQCIDKFAEMAPDEWKDKDIRNGMLLAFDQLGMFMNYYLQHFYCTDAVIADYASRDTTRGEDIIELEESLFAKYSQEDLTEKPEELSKRGGAHYSTAAFHLIDAIHNDTQNTQIVCCRNNGAIPGFDDDATVEIPSIIGKDGAKGIPQEAPEPIIRGLMQQMKAYETLTIKAAVERDKTVAFEAMLTHPLMPGAVGSKVLLDELLEINKPYLDW